MHSNTIFSTVVAAIGIFATVTSAECTVKWTDNNCCFRDRKARTSQDGWTTIIPGTKTGGEIRFADGNLCPDSVKATCSANCCDPKTGWGKGCPNLLTTTRSLWFCGFLLPLISVVTIFPPGSLVIHQRPDEQRMPINVPTLNRRLPRPRIF
ncbi:hypothetical protein ACET3X_004711 [Alternaria dauci]|uniref:Uncharacterized protein n=1 Tax=Alternaria dauci TaxID=48095 RepID=A0ABR3UI60_9PLEO